MGNLELCSKGGEEPQKKVNYSLIPLKGKGSLWGVMGRVLELGDTPSPDGLELRDMRRGSADSRGMAAPERETGSQALP